MTVVLFWGGLGTRIRDHGLALVAHSVLRS
jgi:hypothetical protein